MQQLGRVIPTMKLRVEIGDLNTNQMIIMRNIYDLSLPAFMKHLAISGMDHMPKLYKFTRFIGMSFLYWEFLRDFSKNKFSKPLSGDPTFKGHFSNLAGLAIADFLVRRIDNATHTFNFESITGIQNKKRPDLIAINTQNYNALFVESKGWSKTSVTTGDIYDTKQQTISAISKIRHINLPLNKYKAKHFTVTKGVASISYGLYSKVRAKYYDPEFPKIELGYELIERIIKEYYKGILDIAQSNSIVLEEHTPVYKFDIIRTKLAQVPWSLIVPHNLNKIIRREIEEITFKSIEELSEKEAYYIDTDGIGIYVDLEKFKKGLTWITPTKLTR